MSLGAKDKADAFESLFAVLGLGRDSPVLQVSKDPGATVRADPQEGCGGGKACLVPLHPSCVYDTSLDFAFSWLSLNVLTGETDWYLIKALGTGDRKMLEDWQEDGYRG